MATLRCTQKILRRLRIDPLADDAAPTNRLGDWYANLLNVGRMRLVLCVSEKTLLPVILPARMLRTLPERLPPAVAFVLRHLGVPADVVETEVNALHPVRIGETKSRVVLGSMAEMAYEANFLLGHPAMRASLEQASLRLCGILCGPLGNSTPAEATVRLLGGRVGG